MRFQPGIHGFILKTFRTGRWRSAFISLSREIRFLSEPSRIPARRAGESTTMLKGIASTSLAQVQDTRSARLLPKESLTEFQKKSTATAENGLRSKTAHTLRLMSGTAFQKFTLFPAQPRPVSELQSDSTAESVELQWAMFLPTMCINRTALHCVLSEQAHWIKVFDLA